MKKDRIFEVIRLMRNTNEEYTHQLLLFCDEAWFIFSRFVKSQSSKYFWLPGNIKLTQEVPLNDVKAGMWCAMSAVTIFGRVLL